MRNFTDALRAFRDPTKETLLWDDALFINQADDEEKDDRLRSLQGNDASRTITR
tara:strand:- start:2138 stop:2299 length:162 start_codon:yes stop_codon:yes gene_type:complete